MKTRDARVRDLVLRRRSFTGAARWFVPAGVLTVAGLAVTGVFAANASESKDLPNTTPAALLAAVRAAPTPEGFYGTILSQVSLGLPQLPALSGGAGSSGSSDDGITSFGSLLTGSHTMQVWYGGRDKQRVALLGSMDETDVFHSGRQVWTWNSSQHVARHAVLPAGAKLATPASSSDPSADPSTSDVPSVTPSGLAQQALAALTPTTRVTVAAGQQVADRDAYLMTLTPKTTDTLVGSVRIAVDGATKMPLGVKVFARGATSPAIDIAYTAIHLTPPADSSFQFTPPPGATVRSLHAPTEALSFGGTHRASVSGSGWTRVATLDTGRAVQVARGPLQRVLTPVSGSWGSGGLLQSALLSVLVTSKGAVYAGTVPPETLYAAAGSR